MYSTLRLYEVHPSRARCPHYKIFTIYLVHHLTEICCILFGLSFKCYLRSTKIMKRNWQPEKLISCLVASVLYSEGHFSYQLSVISYQLLWLNPEA
ncbi:MAG: hypothetical protein F6K39_22740 [Okeania sp. SIO3B3]|nr:hypothetical protein [Okeania sp. SIO3B3]